LQASLSQNESRVSRRVLLSPRGGGAGLLLRLIVLRSPKSLERSLFVLTACM